MNKLLLGFTFGVFFSFNSFSTTVNQSLYIVADSLLTVDSTKVPYITFNETLTYNQSNPIINLMQGDTLDLWVFNTDSLVHDFVIKGVSSVISIP